MNLKFAINIVVSLVILAAGGLGLKFFGQKPEVPTQNRDNADSGVEVETAKVEEWNLPFSIEIDGEASTYRVITLGAEVEGRIVKKAAVARSGTYVRKGQLLFEIDSTRYQLEIDRLNAQLQQAVEELAAVAVDLKNNSELTSLAEEDLKLQQKHLQRMQTLYDRKTANDSELETAMKQELTARNALQELKNKRSTLLQQQKTRQAAKALVEAQLKQAEVDLNRCVVVSTLDGRIVDDAVEEGDYIKSGEVLVHISDSSRMEIKCQLQADELAWVWQQPREEQTDGNSVTSSGDPLNLPRVPCEVVYEFNGIETIWDGYIARLEGTGIDRDTRTFPCRVLVEQPGKIRINRSAGGRSSVTPPVLLSGMYVSVRIPVESPVPLLRLPIEAVRPGGQIWVNRSGELDVFSVSPAHVADDWALVPQDNGLSAGDAVVISPLASVRDGMKVREAAEDRQ